MNEEFLVRHATTPAPWDSLPEDSYCNLFDPFKGNNHREIKVDGKWFGVFAISDYLGKPLSGRLYWDLVMRMGVRRMRIYEQDLCAQWTDGGPPRVHLYTKDSLLYDIEFHV